MRLLSVKILVLFTFVLQLCGCSQLEMMNDGASRIVNGNFVDYSQFPYAISLQQVAQLSQTSRGHTCGGALVTLQHALTSGSCLYTQTAPYTLKIPNQYRVFAGASVLTNDTSANHWRNVASFTPHPNYNGPLYYYNDIGIITVVTPFLNTVVSPIGLSTLAPADNTLCSVAGWGATLAGLQASVNLLAVNRLTINQTSCSFLLPGAGGPVLDSHMICVGNTASFTPSCTNDTGNPLVCGTALTGILSWYSACSLTSSLEVYTRTADFATWIRSVTGAAVTPTPFAAILIFAAAFTRVLAANYS